MISYLKHSEIDKTKWDRCINTSLNPFIYAYSWYLDIVAPGWHALIIDDYKAVFPLPTGKKYNIQYVFTPFFVQQLGLFYTDKKYKDPGFLSTVINQIPEEIKYISLHLNEKNSAAGDINFAKRKNYILNLNNSYHKLYESYSHGLKSNLKNARKKNIVIVETSDIGLFVDHYKKQISNKVNHPANYFKIFRYLLHECIERKCASLKIAYLHDKVIAGAVFLNMNNRIFYLSSFADESGKKYSAMPLMIDEMIRDNCETSTVFDFEGSMIKGVAQFFKSFGSAESVYLHLKINRLPRLVRWLKD